MYSAMPSLATASQSHPEGSRTKVGLAIEDLSIDGASQANGRNLEGEEDNEEGQEPLGQNVEHACRWVAILIQFCTHR